MDNRAKWKSSDFKSPFQNWQPPPLVNPCSDDEKEALHTLKNAFAPLPPYKVMEQHAIEQNALVKVDGIPLPTGEIAFLENTAEQCTSPQTKHSQAGMQGARHWGQRVDTPDGVYRRLTEGYGISLMVGERCHQYIRNSNNWRGINGVQLDLDVWHQQPDALKKKLEDEDRDADFIAERLDANEKLPLPVYSQDELFERYPLLPRICSFLIPSASSLYEGRPFKARGIILFPEPVTDMRVYRAFGDILCGELDCIPQNVTKNPVAVGFGNTHNAPQAYRNGRIDTAWISDRLQESAVNVIAKTRHRGREKQQKAELKAHYAANGKGTGEGENISAFIEKCDPVSEMLRDGLLTRGQGNEYQWHTSEHARSCDILDGSIHIFSHSMFDASPHQNINEAVGAHRFYLYQLSGLDMTKEADKPHIRQFLFERGYGSDPKAFAKQQQKQGVSKPVKLKDVEPFKGVLETLDTARDFLRDVFAKGAQFFAVRTDTGTGKTESAITYALTKDVAIPTQSHKLSTEAVSRATDKEIYAWGYRGIGYHPEGENALETEGRTYDADGYFGCIQSERFEALRNKGFNPYKWVCDGCPAYLECKVNGYLSQPDRAKKSQLVALPFPTAFLDPRLRSWADLYKPRGRDALILHDDLPLGSLFISYQLTAPRLRRIYEQWKGTLAAKWAEACLLAFQLRDWETLKEISLRMNADERQSVTYALTQCIDLSSGAVVEPDDYLKSEQVDFSTAEACRELPQMDKEGFDVATMLETFFNRYPRIEDAPFSFDTASETFTFDLPPMPYIFNKTVRFGFASATLEKKLIQAIFPDIQFYDAALTEWKDGAGFFQLRTNSNPRRTVLNFIEQEAKDGKKRYTYDGLSPTGESYYQMAIDFIKAHPNETHAVLSYKTLIEEKKDELDALGVVSGWFGNLAGLDEAFKGVKYFHILFSPEVDPFSIDGLVKQLFGSDETPLQRDADGNLERNEEGTYADERVRLCYEALVIGEIRQVIGRARLNLYPNQVFLWTSRFVDGYTNRADTVLFDEIDWRNAGNTVAKLREAVKTRETAEQNGDVKALVEATGVSERTARRKTETTRNANERAKIDEAYRLYTQENLSYRKIAKRLDVKSHTTIARWLKNYQF